MKFIKKSLLALSLLTLSANTLPHGGGGGGFGGGFAAGALTGVAVTSIASSASNRNNSGDSSSSRANNRINKLDAKQRRLTREYNNGKITQQDYEKQMKRIDDQIDTLSDVL